ncbi:MAG TPA: tRNA adenosine(34) deaminase TadA [Pantanalinema sp.]
MRHQQWMQQAMTAADHARALGEVPVGAVLVHEGRVVATGWNTRETQCDPTGHAELMAMRLGGEALGRWRLTGCTLYVTLEPCPMCAPALVQARLDRVVFGAYDPKLGGAGSVFSLIERPEYPHRVEVIGGIMEAECQAQLMAFFEAKRER